jgi:pyridoxamine 5'-phosphate oxidase
VSDINQYLKQLREDFMKGTLSESEVNPDPFSQFETWMIQAIKSSIPEVQAMNLSTCVNNKPSSRIVYLREFINNHFYFYGNYESKKGKSLSENPNACLNFFWPELERQIRIEGTVKKANMQMSDAYFHARPRESQLGAWASAQSSRLPSRNELEDLLAQQKKIFEGKNVPRPSQWGGWELNATYYEFWQGRKSRLHDRIAYEFKNGSWEIFRLAP